MAILQNMPDQIPVSDLQETSPEYDGNLLSELNALYEGGDSFNNIKSQFLPKRPIEKSELVSSTHYDLRLESAFYTNYAAGIVDWFSAKVVEGNPRIIVGDNISDLSKAYWESLNHNADGCGNPLVTLCRWAAREIIINSRAYWCIKFNEENSIDGRLSLFDAITVDDWQKDVDNGVQWIRRHTVDTIRDEEKPWSAATKELHFWTFYDNEKIIIYTASRDVGKNWNKKDIAIKTFEQYHEFGNPVFDIRSDESMWVMDRIKEPAIKLFQREANLNFYLDNVTIQVPYLNLNDPESWKSLPMTPLGAIVLGLNEKFGYASPSSAGFEPSFKSIELCKRSFYESLQIMAKEAAALPQAGRLSGEAVESMQKPMEILLGSFAWPIQDALERSIASLKEYRTEPDADIRVVGFGKIEADETELEELIFGQGVVNGAETKEGGEGGEETTDD